MNHLQNFPSESLPASICASTTCASQTALRRHSNTWRSPKRATWASNSSTSCGTVWIKRTVRVAAILNHLYHPSEVAKRGNFIKPGCEKAQIYFLHCWLLYQLTGQCILFCDSLNLKHRIHAVGRLISTKIATISWIPTNSPYETILITSLVISRCTKNINQQIYQAWRRSFIPSCEGNVISTLGWAASSACCPQAKRASKKRHFRVLFRHIGKNPSWSKMYIYIYLIERSGDSAF